MSVLEPTGYITPRSVLRYRPIENSTSLRKQYATMSRASLPTVQRASRPALDEIAGWPQEEDSVQSSTQALQTYMQSSGRKTVTISHPAVRATRSQMLVKSIPPRRRIHPLLYIGVGLFGMLFLWTVLSATSGWFSTTLDDIRYGRPRTFQMDAWVGHNEQMVPSHFVALNLKGRVEVIEFPGGDVTHAHVYVGPQLYGAGSDLVPVTLRFVDVSGDKKPDMLISLQGSQSIFINDKGGFRPLLPTERPKVAQILQQQEH